jgi:hypothetical protein
MRLARLTALGVVVGVAVGCDPGMAFDMIGPNHREELDAGGYLEVPADGVEARYYGSIFTAHGSFEVRVTNHAEVPVSFTPTPMLIRDADGRDLKPDCHYSADEAVLLEKDDEVRIRCRVRIHLIDGGCSGPTYGREVRHLTLAQAGFARAGRPLEISVTADAIKR